MSWANVFDSSSGPTAWLVYSVISGLLLLSIGALAVRCCHQSIYRIRIIQWTFVACLIVPAIQYFGLMPFYKVAIAFAEHDERPNSTSPRAQAIDDRTSHDSTAASEIGRPHRNAFNDQLQPESNISDVNVDSSLSSQSITGDVPSRNFSEMSIVFVQSIYFAILTVFAAWWIAGWLMRLHLQRNCQNAREQVAKALESIAGRRAKSVRLLQSDRISSPVMWGIVRPTIVLPMAIARSEDDIQLRWSLAHEWSHIQRYDFLAHQLAIVTKFVCFFQPLFWWLKRELSLSQDIIADAFAASFGESEDYAAFLVEMSKNQNRSITRVGLGIAERRSNLFKRVGQLVQPKRRLLMSASKLFTRAMAATAIILIATIGSVQIIGRQAAADDAQAAANKTDESNTTGEELTQVKSTALAPPLPPAPGVEPITYIGKVVDSVTGEPLAGAKVQIKHELSREPGTDKWVLIEMTEYTTDKDGSYQFTLPPEQVAQGSLYLEVNAHHPSHQSMGWGGYAHSMIRTNIEKGDPPFFATIKLEPGQEITGVVVAPDGKALSDVQIATYTKKQIGATTTNLFDGGSFQKTATDLNGHFRLVVATPGDGVIWIYPKDFAAEAHRLRDRRGDLGTFRLKQGTTISGRVLDENGTPVAGVGVDVRRDGDGAEADEYLGRNAVANGIGAGTNTREDGTFTLHPLPPGKYEMEVAVFATDRTAPDRDWFETFGKTLPHVFTRQKIEIAEGLREQSVILQAVRHATIRGRYVDGQGQPRTGHEQRIAGDINGSTFYGQSTRAGVDGRFEFRVPAGIENVQITASTNEHSSLRWKIAGMKTLTYGYHINLGKIEHDVDGLEIVRYNAPILLIKAVDEHGDQVKEYDVDTEYIVGPEPVNGTVTQALQYPTGSIGLERQGDGRMRSSQMLPDAETTITVTKDGFESQPQSVSLKEGETRELTFVLKKRDADSAIP